ncbi:WD40/YVTN/BNR-like repeat-containing protein [Nitrosomonas sp. wSCUT-2]
MRFDIVKQAVSRTLWFYEVKTVSLLQKLHAIFFHRMRRLSHRISLGLLVLCGFLPSLTQAEIWHSTRTSEMKDVAVAPNGLIWLTGKNGAVWVSDNIYGSSFTQIKASGFSRLSVGPDSTVWVIESNGSLWKIVAGSWIETTAKSVEDVAIAIDGNVWLVEKSGAVSFSRDQGQNFTQIAGTGYSRISTGTDGTIWAVGTDGRLWKFAAERWIQTTASKIGDVAIAPDGLIWLAGKNGTVWSSSDDGVTFSQDEHASGIENIAAGRSGAWSVGFNGTLWRKLFSPQY